LPVLAVLLFAVAFPQSECKRCHAKETAAFAQTGMGRSLGTPGAVPDGAFTHEPSGTKFEIRSTAAGLQQSFTRGQESASYPVAYAIGSGNHAFGYLVRIGDHLFQSPLSYYTQRRLWDVAPGYEQAGAPDFSRPVTPECLSCHSGHARPVANTLNRYQNPPFESETISCDRCHGPVEAHLQRPVPGSILNPARLPAAARDSVCEQCHLAGEIRIPNPGHSLSDFVPGEPAEDVFTVYVGGNANQGLKVISHSEQLALSRCARSSGGKLWCGTCHDPHAPARATHADYRERCLACHAATLSAAHAAPTQDCVTCHMPRLPARDGGHTVFTDHRIARNPSIPPLPETAGLRAWREPPAAFRERNLALALATHGLENGISDEAVRGFKLLSRMEPQLSTDAAALTALGSILLTAKEAKEAEKRFARALALRPEYAPYEVNLANALLESGDRAGAIEHLNHALALDPLLEQAAESLARAYRSQGEAEKAEQVLQNYRTAMGITVRK
jgi:hypothetical protein